MPVGFTGDGLEMLWVALLLIGVAAACAAVSASTLSWLYGSETLTLARLLRQQMRGRERGLKDDPLNKDTAALIVRELVEAAAKKPQRFWMRSDPLSRSAIGLAVTAVICLSLVAAINGSPALPPDTPAASQQRDTDLARLELYTKSLAQPRSTAGPMSTPRQLPDVDTMIERLAARLRSQPDDAEGWRMLGWSYFHVQRPSKAAEAYARAVALRPQSSEFKSAYGEALVGAEGGTVTPEALEAFTGALAIDAQNARARYFVAVSKLQAGKTKDAFEDLLGLQAEASEDEPWMIELRERTKALARELNVDLASHALAATREGDPKGPQPTLEQVRTIQAMPADQQEKMIREMVEGLSRRLEESPHDEEGWLRLIRSRMVLGEQQAARDALKRALAIFSDDVPAGARITAVAKELGVEN
jgi:cytochrome c-type biogenesis protein CcmH